MYFNNHMNKDTLIAKLREFAKKNNHSQKYFYESFRAKILADFLANSDLPTEQHYNALDYLAPVIARGVEKDSGLPQHKQKLGPFTDHDLSSLTALLSSSAEEITRFETIRNFTKLLDKAIAVPGLTEYLNSYWDAQYNVLWQLVDRFNKDVWQKGLYDLVYKYSQRVGKFSKTKLITGSFCGRTSIIFDRGKGRIFFNGEESSPNKLALGPGPETPLYAAIEMIEEVISLWPSDTEKQAKILKPIK